VKCRPTREELENVEIMLKLDILVDREIQISKRNSFYVKMCRRYVGWRLGFNMRRAK